MTSTLSYRSWPDIFDEPPPAYGSKTGVSYIRASAPSIDIYCRDHHTLTIAQDINNELGAVVWDCGLLMVDLINTCSDDYISGQTCLDIGCGTGVCGIVASILGAKKVVLTDYIEFDVMNENIASIGRKKEDCQFILYNWTSRNLKAALNPAFGGQSIVIDTVLGSDILYDPSCYESLEVVLSQLEFKRMIVTYKRRHDEREKEFLQKLELSYTIQEIVLPEVTGVRRNCDSRCAVGVHILLFIPRSELDSSTN